MQEIDCQGIEESRIICDKVNFLNDAKEFYESHVPSQTMSIPSLRGIICLQPDTRKSFDASGHVFEGRLARGELSSALFENSMNLASSTCRRNASHLEVLRKELLALPRIFRLGILFIVQEELFLKLYDGKSEESDLGLASR